MLDTKKQALIAMNEQRVQENAEEKTRREEERAVEAASDIEICASRMCPKIKGLRNLS